MNKISIYIFITLYLLSFSKITSADDHPIKLNFILKTINPYLDKFDNLNYGSQFEFQYGLNKYLYIKAISVIYNENQIGYGGRLGYTFNYYLFSPYTEVGFDSVPSINNRVTYFSYNVGSYLHIGKKLSPFFELDNADLPKRTAIKMGSVFQITKNMAIKADYIQDLSHSGNGAEIQFSFTL